MTSEALPLVLATVFTAGGLAIQKAWRYAGAVGHALGVVFSVVVALLLLEIVVQVLPQADGVSPAAERTASDPPKQPGRVEVWD